MGETKRSYQQFADVDSDEARPKPGREAAAADSSSEGGGATEPRNAYKRDYGYRELEDEYGSKKASLSVAEGEEGENQGSKVAQQEEACSPPPDRIVGHAYGVRPLLDDDELSDSETAQLNPFSGVGGLSSRGSSVVDSSGPTSPAPPTTDQSDIFKSAPFSSSKRRESHKKKKAVCSPQTDAAPDGDVFGRVPFKSRGMKSPPTEGLVFENAFAQEQPSCVFDAAPFHPKAPPTCELSPKVDPFGSGNFAEMSFTQAQAHMVRQVLHQAPPPQSHAPKVSPSPAIPSPQPAVRPTHLSPRPASPKALPSPVRSSEGSEGSEGRLTPRLKKDRHRRQGELLHPQDENASEVGARRRSGRKSRPKGELSEFSNLGFTDDSSEKEEKRSLSNSTEALRPSHAANCGRQMGEGCHTLPRAAGGRKQHRILPPSPNQEALRATFL